MKQKLILFFVLFTYVLNSQNLHFRSIELENNLQLYKNLKELPEKFINYKSKSLPYKVDNSGHKAFPPLISQYNYSCGQFAGVYYNFTYEINRLRGVNAALQENQYSAYFTYTIFNKGLTGVGVSYFDSWRFIRDFGHPSSADYLYGFAPDYTTHSMWMSGFDKYYRSFSNRIKEFYSIDVSNTEGLHTLKNWLHNHCDGSETGGVANIYIGSWPEYHVTLPEESEHSGEYLVYSWSVNPGHAVTIVGYNDSIKYDFNNDGLFTNHLDINNDNVLDLRDYEVGAFKVVNSFDGWANNNSIWMPYRLLAIPIVNGGIWDNSVHVLVPEINPEPSLIAKLKLSHGNRESIKVNVGFSNDTTAFSPDHIYSLPFLDNQGGDHYMQGLEFGPAKILEFGLELSEMAADLPDNKPVKLFLQVYEKDKDSDYEGEIRNFSIITLPDSTEYICTQEDVIIQNDTLTQLSVIIETPISDIHIIDSILEYEDSSILNSFQLTASSENAIDKWELIESFYETKISSSYPEEPYEIADYNYLNNATGVVVPEFSFPFYGQEYDTIYFTEDGYIYFNDNLSRYPYALNNNYYLKLGRIIAPFFDDCEIAPLDNLFVKSESDKVSIIWRVSKNNILPSKTEANFAATLHKNGNIEFHYDSISYLGNTWKSGISEGNDTNYIIPSFANQTNLVEYQSFLFTKIDQNTFSLSPSGMLSFTPMYSPDSVLVRVYDTSGKTSIKTIYIREKEEYENGFVQNFPNPFIDQTTISFSLENSEYVSMNIYDIHGRLVSSLINKELEAGVYNIDWNQSLIPSLDQGSGVYILKMKTTSFSKNIKLIKAH